MRAAVQSVAIALSLALSVVAITLPQIQRSSAPELIREKFSVGERVYELRVAPLDQTKSSSDAVLAEALRTLLRLNSDGPRDPSYVWQASIPSIFLGSDGFAYGLYVLRLEGDSLSWGEHEGINLLQAALTEMIPEGYEDVGTR